MKYAQERIASAMSTYLRVAEIVRPAPSSLSCKQAGFFGKLLLEDTSFSLF